MTSAEYVTSPHHRTLITEHVARQLIRRGAWEDAIFVDRATAIGEDALFPNICIYANRERTQSESGDESKIQELTLLIEIRAKRPPDMKASWPAPDQLPSVANQSFPANRILNNACKLVEQIVFTTFNRQRINFSSGDQIDFRQIVEINTEITHNAEGEVPYMLASIDFVLVFEVCYPFADVRTCDLTHIFGESTLRVCNDNSKTVQSARVPLPRTLNPGPL
jgi:hypothetical protein